MTTETDRKVDRSELALWADGSRYSVDGLQSMYTDYCVVEEEHQREPLCEAHWCEHVVEGLDV